MAATVPENVLGQQLSVPHKLAVGNALVQLKLFDAQAYSSIALWGKISAIEKDYLVAVGLRIGETISKDFFVSDDNGVTFSKLPQVDAVIEEKSSVQNGRFTGNLAYKYKNIKPKPANAEDGAEEPAEEEEEPEEEAPAEPEVGEDGEPLPAKLPDPAKRRLTELERVAYTVQQIDQSTAVVPLGAYLLTPTSEVVLNKAFAGLSVSDAAKLSSYGLLRDSRSAKTQARVRRAGPVNQTAFLDPVSEEQPAGSWTLQVDESGRKVSLRNLLWPGFELRTEAGSASWSSGYFGTGEKNEDLLFML